MKEYLGLSSNNLEKNKSVQELLRRFQSVLPAHFGSATFISAPINTSLDHVIRADCKDHNCRVRALAHVRRNERGILEIVESDDSGKIEIQYDRTNSCCSNCSVLK